MNPPFTVEQFLNVFREYNNAVWPMQIILNLLGFLIIVFIIWKIRLSDVFINITLAFFWLWMGIVYHLVYFTPINKAAFGFGTIFILQGLLFLYFGVISRKLSFRNQHNYHSTVAALLIFYGMIIYPVIGHISGHQYPASPTFGLPCPATIFTLGILHFSEKRLPVAILIIPVLWSFIGFTAALKFGIWEDTGLLIAGLLSIVNLIILRQRK